MNDGGVQIRIGGREDLPLLFNICKSQSRDEFCLWGADFVYDYPPNLTQMERSFETRKNTVFYVAEVSGCEVGLAEITEIDYEKRCGVLARIILDPSRRGTGLGRKFIQEIAKKVRQDLGLEEISLIVYSHNQNARKCYEACGFLYEKEMIRPGRPDAFLMKINV